MTARAPSASWTARAQRRSGESRPRLVSNCSVLTYSASLRELSLRSSRHRVSIRGSGFNRVVRIFARLDVTIIEIGCLSILRAARVSRFIDASAKHGYTTPSWYPHSGRCQSAARPSLRLLLAVSICAAHTVSKVAVFRPLLQAREYPARTLEERSTAVFPFLQKRMSRSRELTAASACRN